jgi:hypothetical protein
VHKIQSTHKFSTGDETDPFTGGNLIDFYRSQGSGCAIACIGIIDSINNFVGNFANWLGSAAGVGSVLGALEGILAGETGAALLTWAGLGSLAGAAVVVAFTGGWLVGTGIYGGFTHIVYGDGRVVPISR